MTDEEVLELVPVAKQLTAAVALRSPTGTARVLAECENVPALAVMLAELLRVAESEIRELKAELERRPSGDLLVAYNAVLKRAEKAETDRDDWRGASSRLTAKVERLKQQQKEANT